MIKVHFKKKLFLCKSNYLELISSFPNDNALLMKCIKILHKYIIYTYNICIHIYIFFDRRTPVLGTKSPSGDQADNLINLR